MIDMNAVIASAARAIVASRDLCGNERAACLDAFADDGIAPTSELISKAFGAAEAEWRKWQQRAGVFTPTPLSR